MTTPAYEYDPRGSFLLGVDEFHHDSPPEASHRFFASEANSSRFSFSLVTRQRKQPKGTSDAGRTLKVLSMTDSRFR